MGDHVSPIPRKGRRARDVPVHVLSSPAWKDGGFQNGVPMNKIVLLS
jgi:hypothetical protein